jgi:hypothetical protein
MSTERKHAKEGWRKLVNEELHNLHSSAAITGVMKSRRMRWMGHVSGTWETRDAQRILVGKLEGKRINSWRMQTYVRE